MISRERVRKVCVFYQLMQYMLYTFFRAEEAEDWETDHDHHHIAINCLPNSFVHLLL